jgi:hypothetical protein
MADLELKRGIGRFAGKSGIAEGRSDLRESGIRCLRPFSRSNGSCGRRASMAMFGCQSAVRRCCEKLVLRCGGTAEQRCSEKRYCVVPKSGIAVRRAAGAAERREAGCCGNCVGRVWCDRDVGAAVLRTARAAVPAKSQALVGPCPVPVRLLEAAPWVLG